MTGNAITDKINPASADTAGEAKLDKDVQEHLGQHLRAAYYEASERPAYLGDPAVPAEFDPHVRKLEQRDRIHNRGVEAVEEALGPLIGGPQK
jgi:hypothetical protein